mmetsp:Transcript_3176/g.7129  ORF Transcript_3176/g.7129 Transcript_3176/m.7129 type:complete len:229 (-) Transcript_3176:40-726(-)
MLKLYGVAGSQPARAIMWLLAMKEIPYEMVETMPGSKNEKPLGSRSASYLAKVPTGNVPAIEDTENGMILWESNAILTYIAEKYRLEDLYPSQDIVKRAKIQQWLHWHHHNTRVLTFGVFGPHFRPDIKFNEVEIKGNIRKAKNACQIMNDQLSTADFLVGDSLTLADIACYEDLGQCASHNLALFDFSKYPAVESWIQRLEKLPKHQETHKVFGFFKKMLDKQRSKM